MTRGPEAVNAIVALELAFLDTVSATVVLCVPLVAVPVIVSR